VTQLKAGRENLNKILAGGY